MRDEVEHQTYYSMHDHGDLYPCRVSTAEGDQSTNMWRRVEYALTYIVVQRQRSMDVGHFTDFLVSAVALRILRQSTHA